MWHGRYGTLPRMGRVAGVCTVLGGKSSLWVLLSVLGIHVAGTQSDLSLVEFQGLEGVV